MKLWFAQGYPTHYIGGVSIIAAPDKETALSLLLGKLVEEKLWPYKEGHQVWTREDVAEGITELTAPDAPGFVHFENGDY